MLKGSHSFICHPHVYPRMEWAILPLFPAAEHQPVLISRPTKGRKLSWPRRLVTYRGGRLCPPEDGHPSQYQPTDSVAAGDRIHDHWVATGKSDAITTRLPSHNTIHTISVLRGGSEVGWLRLAIYMSRVQFPAGRLSRNIGQLSIAPLRGR